MNKICIKELLSIFFSEEISKLLANAAEVTLKFEQENRFVENLIDFITEKHLPR